MRYICQICGYVYDEEKEGIPFSELPADWKCPMCGAPKAMFAAEEEENRETEAGETVIDTDMTELSPGILAALFSNLARGSEKQYKAEESGLFRKIAEYFTSVSSSLSEEDTGNLKEISKDNSGRLFPSVMDRASSVGDRGALRACTWASKVEMIVQALLDRYEKEGESFLENTSVWVCSICGFVYVGDAPPAICPVCKVPDWKFTEVV